MLRKDVNTIYGLRSRFGVSDNTMREVLEELRIAPVWSHARGRLTPWKYFSNEEIDRREEEINAAIGKRNVGSSAGRALQSMRAKKQKSEIAPSYFNPYADHPQLTRIENLLRQLLQVWTK